MLHLRSRDIKVEFHFGRGTKELAFWLQSLVETFRKAGTFKLDVLSLNALQVLLMMRLSLRAERNDR